MFFTKKRNPHETGCFVCHLVVAIILLLASVASLLGVLSSHYDPRTGSLIFGTASASLSLIALAYCATHLLRQVKTCLTACDVCNGKK